MFLAIALISWLVLSIGWLFLDCDLTLFFCTIFGKRPRVLKTKVIWITGASYGIGASLALELAKQAGSKLILSARRENLLEDVKLRCLQVNANLNTSDVLVLPMDMLDGSNFKIKFRQVLKTFGKLDILVHNAGVTHLSKVQETTAEKDREIFEVNVLSVMNLSKIVLNFWLANNLPGHFVVNSSAAGILPTPPSSSYSASKHALHGFFETLKLELFN